MKTDRNDVTVTLNYGWAIARKAVVIGSIGLLLVASATAQEVRTDRATQVSSDPQLRRSARDSAAPNYVYGTLEEVLVTATRRSERVQDVPGQVAVQSAQDLEQINAHSLTDFAAYVPGLSIAPGVGTLVAIRGVTTGNQLSSAIGLYLDDVPLGSSSSFGLGFQSFAVNVYDLDRVEVLNGPQGTLYGANSLGGALKYVTAPPDTHAFSAKAQADVSYTDHGSVNDAYYATLNAPFGDGLGAIRVNGLHENAAGYAADPIFGREHQGAARTNAGRISLLLNPTEDLDFRLTALIQDVPADGINTAFRDRLTGDDTFGTYDQAYPLEQPLRARLELYSAVANWSLPWAKLTSISAYQNNHGDGRTDQSLTYDAIFANLGGGNHPWQLYVDADTHRFTQELRLVSNQTEHVQWLAGVYYDHESTNESVAVLDATTPSGDFFGIPVLKDDLPSTYREYAVYADGTLLLTPRFSLGLGYRYSDQHQTYQATTQGLLATGSSLVYEAPRSISDENVSTYAINPKYQLTDNTMLYARAASGFRPGGPNFVLAQGLSNPTFKADKLWNYEIGEKSTFLDNRLQLNLGIYDIEWHDVQVTINTGGVNQLVNSGDARIRGAEMLLNYRALPNLNLGGSASYTDARLVTPAAELGITGDDTRLPLSPKYNFAALGTYSFDVSGDYAAAVTLAHRYVGDRTAGFGTSISRDYRLDAFNTTDLDVSLSTPHHIQLVVYLKNIFNTAGELAAATGANSYNPFAPVPVTMSMPRTVGLTVKAQM